MALHPRRQCVFKGLYALYLPCFSVLLTTCSRQIKSSRMIYFLSAYINSVLLATIIAVRVEPYLEISVITYRVPERNGLMDWLLHFSNFRSDYFLPARC
jgi:hypothetical protein